MSDHHSWKILKPHRKNPFWFRYLDDITEFKEKYCCLDRRGKLYELNIESMKMVNLLVSEPIYGREAAMIVQRRKRLVVDPTSKELHLLVREPKIGNVRFKLYKFNECCKKWDVVEHLGKNRVLFVGVDHCFFAKANDFTGCKGNCIVFAANCFTQYRGRNTPDRRLFGDDDDVEVGVYRIGKGDNFRLLSSVYGEFSKSIWPPPIWLSPKSGEYKAKKKDSSSSRQEDLDEENSSTIKCHSDDHVEPMLIDSSDEGFTDKDKDEEIRRNSSSSKPYNMNDTNGITKDKEQQRSSFNEQTYNFEEHFSTLPLPMEYNVGTSKMDYQKTGVYSGQCHSKEEAYNANSTPVTPSANLRACSTFKFEGVDINYELLPTLQTISKKHGSLIGEDTIHNKAMRAYALESVAKLQRVGLEVDWLVPAMEKMSKLQKHKQLIEDIHILNKKKAEIDEEEKKFLAHTTKVKQEIEEDMACLSATIPSFELIDLDDCLGGGLF